MPATRSSSGYRTMFPDAELASTLSSGSGVAEKTPDWFWTADFLGNADRATTEQPSVALVGIEPGRYVVGDPFRPVNEVRTKFSVRRLRHWLQPLQPVPGFLDRVV